VSNPERSVSSAQPTLEVYRRKRLNADLKQVIWTKGLLRAEMEPKLDAAKDRADPE
jgi:hypothetical protein